MKKYNLSKIMKEAWALIKRFGISKRDALLRAWFSAKNPMEIVRMAYAEYKAFYNKANTVAGSYDSVTKTIEVYVTEQIAKLAKKMKTVVRMAYGEYRKNFISCKVGAYHKEDKTIEVFVNVKAY